MSYVILFICLFIILTFLSMVFGVSYCAALLVAPLFGWDTLLVSLIIFAILGTALIILLTNEKDDVYPTEHTTEE